MGLEAIEGIARALDKANALFSSAVAESNNSRRKVLLEEAFKAYVDILTYIPPYKHSTTMSMVLIKRAVLEKIHVIEAMIEKEIEQSVTITASSNSDSHVGNGNGSSSVSSGNSTSMEIEEALTRARLSID